MTTRKLMRFAANLVVSLLKLFLVLVIAWGIFAVTTLLYIYSVANGWVPGPDWACQPWDYAEPFDTAYCKSKGFVASEQIDTFTYGEIGYQDDPISIGR